MKLVHQGFYNGLTFQRVVRGFIVQGVLRPLAYCIRKSHFRYGPCGYFKAWG